MLIQTSFEIKNSANSVPEQPEYLYLCRTVDTAQVCKTVLGLHKQLQFETQASTQKQRDRHAREEAQGKGQERRRVHLRFNATQ